jgi:hypothetical protein
MARSGTALLLRRWEDGIRIYLGGCGLDSTGSGQGPVADFCECGDEPSCSYATELELLGEKKFIFRISYIFPTMAVPWLRLLWWTKWHWDRFFSDLRFFHHGS